MNLVKKCCISVLILLPSIASCSATNSPTPQSNPTVGAQATTVQDLATTAAATATAVEVAPTIATSGQSTALPTSTSTLTVAPTAGNPVESLSSAVHSFSGVTSYRLVVTVAGGTPNENGTTNLEVANGSDSHIVNRGGEFYIIGNTFYIKQGANGKWLKLASSAGSGLTAALFAPRDTLLKATSEKNVSLVGPDILSGKPMLVYQYTPDPTLEPNRGPTKVWVGVTDGLPYQVISVDKNGKTTTLVFSDYNAPITLTPPIP